jgi:hypothetical protein
MIDMKKKEKQKKIVVPLQLSIEAALAKVRAAVQTSFNVEISKHAQERLNERDFTVQDVIKVLQRGDIDKLPIRTTRNEWQCKVTLKLRGIRTAGVVVIILINDRLFVKTVEWETMK